MNFQFDINDKTMSNAIENETVFGLLHGRMKLPAAKLRCQRCASIVEPTAGRAMMIGAVIALDRYELEEVKLNVDFLLHSAI